MNKPFNPYTDLEAITAEYQKGQEEKRIRREAGLPEPKFVDYIGLLDGDKHTDLTQTDEERERWNEIRKTLAENFARKHTHADEDLEFSLTRDLDGGYFDIVHGKMRTPGMPSSIPYVVGLSGPHLEMHSYQRTALERIKEMSVNPMFFSPPRGMGKLGFGGHVDEDGMLVAYDFEATIDWDTRFKELLDKIDNSVKMKIDPMFTIDSFSAGLAAGHRSGKSGMTGDMMQATVDAFKSLGSLPFRIEYKRLHEAGKKHEQICKQLLKPHKKRRKAIRKQLDIIGSEFK